MKTNRPINWYIWRKERLDKSLFFPKQTNAKVPYSQIKLLTRSKYLLYNIYLTSLSNKTNTSLSANTPKSKLTNAPPYSAITVWLNYNLYTTFHLYMSYSLVRTFRVSYSWLNYWSYSQQVSHSKRIKELQQARYYRFSRKL
jgi:hypothetical protein